MWTSRTAKKAAASGARAAAGASAGSAPYGAGSGTRAAEEAPGYTDLEPIGQGGFSTVYRAWQPDLHRVVALKILSLELGGDGVRKRFLREVQLTGRLTGHPHVVTVLETGTARSGRPYLAMEYFERGSLKARLDAAGPLPASEVAALGAKVAGALAAAHELGIVHRDVKPQNILLSRYGEPALADFGIARLLTALDRSTNTEALTPYHAAPEVLEGAAPDAASDVYSLGSTLYQLLAGRPPYARNGDGIATLLLRVLSEPPPPITRADVPEELRAVVLRAMARQPGERFAGARELAAALARVAARGEWAPVGSGAAGSGAVSGDVDGFAVPVDPGLGGEWAPVGGGAARSGAVSGDVSGFAVPVDPGLGGSGSTGPDFPLPDTKDLTSPGLPTVERGAPPADPALTVSRPGRAVVAQADVPVARRSRKGWYVAAAVVSVAALAAGAYWAVHRGGHPVLGTAKGAVVSSAPTPSAVPSGVLAAARPAGLTAKDSGVDVELRWNLAAGNRDALVVQSAPSVDGITLRPVADGATSFSLTGLDPHAGYCFQVGAVVAWGTPSTVAWSAPVCIRGASPVPQAAH